MSNCPSTYTEPISGMVCTFLAKYVEPDGTITCEYLCPDGSVIYTDCP